MSVVENIKLFSATKEISPIIDWCFRQEKNVKLTLPG
jgi:hypothetical protein